MKSRPNYLFVNTISAVLQTLVYTVLLAILYRYIIDKLGISRLGLWSIILSTTSLAGIGNSGISSSITKFVSHYFAKNDQSQIIKIIHSSIILTSILSGLFTIIFYILFRIGLHFFIKDQYLIQEGIKLLPLSFISLFINSIASVFLSCLDGLHKIYIRSTIVIISVIIYVIASILLIKNYALLGIAYAQLLQAIITFLLPIIFLLSRLKTINLLLVRWDKETIREIFQYSLRLQFITILQVITDPIVKLLLSKFGSIQIIGYYDMALKIINGIRSLIVSASQALVPEIAKLKSLGKSKELLLTFFKSQQIVTILSILIFPSLAGLSSVISKLWLGHIQSDFIITLNLVCMGYFLNILSVPFYFLNISTGHLKPNTTSAIFSTTFTILLGALIGIYIHTYGVIIAWIIASFIGTLVLHFYFKQEFSEVPSIFVFKDIYLFIVSSCINILIFFNFFLRLEYHLTTTIAISIGLYVVMLLFIIYSDKRLFQIFKKNPA